MPTLSRAISTAEIDNKSKPLSTHQSTWTIINPFLKNINLWPSYIPTAEIDFAIDVGSMFRR